MHSALIRTNTVLAFPIVDCRISIGNGYSEENWHKLRSLLVEMRDIDTDMATESGTSALSTQQLQYLKHSAALQVHVHVNHNFFKTLLLGLKLWGESYGHCCWKLHYENMPVLYTHFSEAVKIEKIQLKISLFFFLSIKTLILGMLDCLREVVTMSTHNICFR